jgi:dUTP pyrophosphatase
METVKVKIENLLKDDILRVPFKGTPLRAYYDVCSSENVSLVPEKVFMIHTGIKVQPPEGYFIDIRPRSGLAKEGVTINNAPGTLDCDYGGELIIELIWHSSEHQRHPAPDNDTIVSHYQRTYEIKKGDRIAQINVMPMYAIEWVLEKVEGTPGFGSTGR